MKGRLLTRSSFKTPLFWRLEVKKIRKIRAPIKIKSALPPSPPKPPPKKGEFYGHGFSCRENAFFPGVHKIGAAISGPRITDTNFTDTRIFLKNPVKIQKTEEKIATNINKQHFGIVPGMGGCRNVRSGKLQNESFPNSSNFRPEFCPEFCSELSPNYSRIFRASFRGRRRPEKIHQKSPPFFNAKFPGKNEKNNSQNSSGEQAK